jgi:hypothetical protein
MGHAKLTVALVDLPDDPSEHRRRHRAKQEAML